ncbi:MAG TPA: endonuclease/exonuclease/phosphatase family protein, partial [Paludibacter sp.]
MKKYIVYNICFLLFLLLLPFGISSCLPPPVDEFDDTENGVVLEKTDKVTALTPDSTVVVMTWNIRFGIGRGPWFGDACGYKVVYNSDEVLRNLQLLVDRIELIRPDILLLQEVDINSNRSGYTDQFTWLLNHTYFNYASYGSQWKAQFIPSDGLGRLQEVNAIYSRWPITECTRTQLALRKDQIAIEKYFYERCCMVTSKVEIPGFEPLYVV